MNNGNNKQSTATKLFIHLLRLEKNELKEEDFYPPEDTRMIHSGLDDIEDGDSFNDYIGEYWELYKDEELGDLY